MRNRGWMRAGIGAGAGLAVALLLGLVAEVFWFPVGIGITAVSGAAIAGLRPIPAAVYAWTVVAYWYGLLAIAGPETITPVSFLATVRSWGPLIAVWTVGMMLIGLAWLNSRGGEPTGRVRVLMGVSIFVAAGGSLLWAAVDHVPAHSILLGLPNSTLWKVVLFPGVVGSLVGFTLALRRAGGPSAQADERI